MERRQEMDKTETGRVSSSSGAYRAFSDEPICGYFWMDDDGDGNMCERAKGHSGPHAHLVTCKNAADPFKGCICSDRHCTQFEGPLCAFARTSASGDESAPARSDRG